MRDKSNDQKQEGLHLVSSQSREELERRKMLEALSNSEWNSGTFEEALGRKELMLRRITIYEEKPKDSEAAAEALKAGILDILERSSDFDLVLTPEIIKYLNNAFEKLMIHFAVLNLAADSRHTDYFSRLVDPFDHEIFSADNEVNTEKLRERLQSRIIKFQEEDIATILAKLHITRLTDQIPQFLLNKLKSKMHLEKLTHLLKETWGIDIGSDTDIVRLAIAEINKNAVMPHVMVIPNSHKPYNPFFAALKFDKSFGLSAKDFRSLRMFNR